MYVHNIMYVHFYSYVHIIYVKVIHTYMYICRYVILAPYMYVHNKNMYVHMYEFFIIKISRPNMSDVIPMYDIRCDCDDVHMYNKQLYIFPLLRYM